MCVTVCVLQAVAPVLDNPNEPVSDLSYFDCLDLVMEKSRVTRYMINISCWFFVVVCLFVCVRNS